MLDKTLYKGYAFTFSEFYTDCKNCVSLYGISNVNIMQEILEAFGQFSQAERQLFDHKLVKKKIFKNEVLLKPGEISRSLFFILEGSFYQFYICGETEEKMITDLYTGNDWFFNAESLLDQTPSKSAIVCFENAVVAELTLESIHELIAYSQRFLQLNKIFRRINSKVHIYDKNMTPMQKYSYLLESTPQWLQAFPLSMISSYLKIRPETLSRVRANVII